MNDVLNVDVIAEYIKANNLTQREFCLQRKISRYAFCKIMQSNTFNLKTSFRVAGKLNVPVYQLFK